MRASNSSVSLILRSSSSTPRRALNPWIATAARPRSWEPSRTASTTSEMRRLRSFISRPPALLPALEALRRRSSARAGSWLKHHSTPTGTLTVHRPPSRLMPWHRATSALPPPALSPRPVRRARAGPMQGESSPHRYSAQGRPDIGRAGFRSLPAPRLSRPRTPASAFVLATCSAAAPSAGSSSAKTACPPHRGGSWRPVFPSRCFLLPVDDDRVPTDLHVCAKSAPHQSALLQVRQGVAQTVGSHPRRAGGAFLGARVRRLVSLAVCVGDGELQRRVGLELDRDLLELRHA